MRCRSTRVRNAGAIFVGIENVVPDAQVLEGQPVDAGRLRLTAVLGSVVVNQKDIAVLFGHDSGPERQPYRSSRAVEDEIAAVIAWRGVRAEGKR